MGRQLSLEKAVVRRAVGDTGRLERLEGPSDGSRHLEIHGKGTGHLIRVAVRRRLGMVKRLPAEFTGSRSLDDRNENNEANHKDGQHGRKNAESERNGTGHANLHGYS